MLIVTENHAQGNGFVPGGDFILDGNRGLRREDWNDIDWPEVDRWVRDELPRHLHGAPTGIAPELMAEYLIGHEHVAVPLGLDDVNRLGDCIDHHMVDVHGDDYYDIPTHLAKLGRTMWGDKALSDSESTDPLTGDELVTLSAELDGLDHARGVDYLVNVLRNDDTFGRARSVLEAAVLDELASRGIDPPPTAAETATQAETHDAAPAPDSEADRAALITARILHGDAILNIPPKAPLVEGWLDQGDFAVMFGRSGAGKSFVAIDIAGAVATGNWWHGAEVEAGHVLYLIAEGAQGVPDRWRAWKARNNIYSSVDRMHWLPVRVNLRAPLWAQAVAQAAATVTPSLVIIDTLARTFAGGNENSSEDMGAYVAGADTIRETTGATVLVVHHSGKDESAGSRGHSSLLGALDAELAVRNGGDGIITIESTKQKDRGTPTARRFVLEPRGESVAIVPYNGHNHGDELTKKAVTALASLEAIATADGVSTAVWREKAESDGVSRSTFYEARKALLDRGLVRNLGTTDRGPFAPAQEADDA